MQAKQRLRIKGCGKQVDQIDATLLVEESPAWSLDLGAPPSGGSSLAGSDAVAGRRDRKVTLQTDAAGVAALTARLGALATALCGSDTGADGVEIKAFKLVRGKKAARFKLTVKFAATTGKRGNLAVRGKGVLEPVSTTTVTSTTVPESTTSTSIIGTSSTTVTSTTIVTSTTLKSTTTVTTSSTTTVFNECQGVADGVGCLDDGEVCTRDLCMGEVCTHTTPQVAGFSCRPANGSPCDVADTCTGGLVCPDQKSTLACPGPVPAQLPCHEGGVLFCDGHSDDCPPEPLCLFGAPCNADDQCTTGACVQGACAEPAQACAPGDSAADCPAPLVCTDNVCTDPTASPCCELGGNPHGVQRLVSAGRVPARRHVLPIRHGLPGVRPRRLLHRDQRGVSRHRPSGGLAAHPRGPATRSKKPATAYRRHARSTSSRRTASRRRDRATSSTIALRGSIRPIPSVRPTPSSPSARCVSRLRARR
jgi:hypothetical protein